MRLFVAAYPPPDVCAHFGQLVDRLAVARPTQPGRSTRLATPDRWHLTLAFIGDVADEQADVAVEALRDLPVAPPTVRIAGAGRFGRGKFTTLVAGIRDETPQPEAGERRQGRPRSREPEAAREPGVGAKGAGARDPETSREPGIGRELRASGEPGTGRASGAGREPGTADGGIARLGDAVRRALRRRRLPFDHKPLRPHITIARPGDRLTAAELAADLAALDGYEGLPWTVDEVRLVRSYPGPNPEYEPITTVALTR